MAVRRSRSVALWIAALVALHAFPLATASASLDAGVAVVQAEDAYGESCFTATTGVCLADAEGTPSDPGEMVIHARQEFRYVGVATDFEGLPVLEEIPDQQKTVRGRDITARHGLIHAVDGVYHRILPNPPLSDRVGLILGPDNLTVYYVGPAPYDPTGPTTYYDPGLTYTREEDGWVGYEHVGPFNAELYGHIDSEWNALPETCFFTDSVPGCHTLLSVGATIGKDTTPDIHYGFEWEDVQVATDPDALAGSHGASPTEPSGALGAPRNSPSLPVPPPRHATSTPDPERHEPHPVGPSRVERPLGSTPPSGAGHELRITGASPGATPQILILAAATLATVLVALGAILYSRFTKPEHLLKNKLRMGIVELVQADPGLSASELASRLDVSPNAVAYHLAMLQRNGVIVIVAADGRTNAVFPRSATTSQLTKDRLLRHSVRGRLLQLLQAAPEGLRRVDLHQRLPDVPMRTRNHVLKSLVDSRIVESWTDDAGTVRFRLGPAFSAS